MRKIQLASISLVLALTMMVSVALPVAAASPNDKQPVAWVSWDGCSAKIKNLIGQIQVSVQVKQLADGSTVGHLNFNNFDTGDSSKGSPLDSFFFGMNGSKIANIFTTGEDFYLWWNLVDGGEPAAGKDTIVEFVWAAYNGQNPFLMSSYINPGTTPAWPPDITKIFVMTDPPTLPPVGVPLWYVLTPQQTIEGGQIQIHLPTD